jgi:hypothetical protein
VASLDQAMNAASGILLFPNDKLEIVSISKNGSIFNLWVQEPTFSNSAGTLNFEGIVLNPGFIGSDGKIITINFKAKSVGSAKLILSSASVLANDGKGTNILTNLGSANFSLVFKEETNLESIKENENLEKGSQTNITAGVPKKPVVISPTHPDPDRWYSNKNPKFVWELPKDVTAVRLLVNNNPNSLPTIFYSEPISEKQLEDFSDGVWYFHIQFQNKFGWGEVSHFKFQIDTQPPKPFDIKILEGEETTNPQPTLFFDTTDEPSGIEYYEVKIGEWESGKLSISDIKHNPFKTQILPPGKYTVLVKAVDKAENYTLSMSKLTILPIETPLITDYPQNLLPGEVLSIKGKSIPEAKVKIYIQRNEKQEKIDETKSDTEGNWSYVLPEPLELGVYNVWVEAINSLGAKSQPSEKIVVRVSPPVFIKIGKLVIDYLTTIITLLILLLSCIFVIIWFWQKMKNTQKRLRKEVLEAEKSLYHAFNALRDEVKEQVTDLDGNPDLSEREEKIYKDLKEALRISEKFIGKEIRDIEKELDKFR